MEIALYAALLQTQLPRDGLSIAADVSIVVVAVAVLLLAMVLTFVLLRANRAVGEVRAGIRQSLGPVSDRARSISDNVDFITQALRTDVERLNASVRALSDRLHQASDHMEERIEEFNALMEVVQTEAEDIFLDTAATVRGVREGARTIAKVGRPTRTPDDLATDDEDEPGEGDEASSAEEVDAHATGQG